MRKVKAIQRKSLADEVAEQIQGQIEKGVMRKGEKIPVEPELMNMFGVGRSTIREAVKMLVNRGLLNVQQGRGTFVACTIAGIIPWEQKLERAEVKDIREVRDMIESSIAVMAAERRTDTDLKDMRSLLEERKVSAEGKRLEDCIEADAKFHLAIAKATHNELIAGLYKSIATAWQRSSAQLYEDTSEMISSQHRHEALYTAIKKGDSTATHIAAEDLLQGIWKKQH